MSNDTSKLRFCEWMWESTITDAGKDGASKIMALRAEMGISDVYLLVKGTAGRLGYLNTAYKELRSENGRDVLREAIDAAHKYGIRLHAWICNCEDSSYKASHPESGMRHYVRGLDNNKINLYDHGYTRYMCSIAKEIAAYGVDGLHLDYIRYNHLSNGWSKSDLSALENMGASIPQVKELLERTFGYNGKEAIPGYAFDALAQNDATASLIARYRRNNVTRYAAKLIEAAKSVDPNIAVSAATMPEGAYSTEFADLHYGQNYCDTAALFDHICPMAYSSSFGKDAQWMQDIARLSIQKGNKVIMGIQAFDTSSENISRDVFAIKKLADSDAYCGKLLGCIMFRSSSFDYASVRKSALKNTLSLSCVSDLPIGQGSVTLSAENGIRFLPQSSEHARATVSEDGFHLTLTPSKPLSALQKLTVDISYEGDIEPPFNGLAICNDAEGSRPIYLYPYNDPYSP